MNNRHWIHWVFLGAIFLYVCLFGVETVKFIGGGINNTKLTADLAEVVDSNIKIEPTAYVLDVFDISWKQETNSKYSSGENIFKADVNGTETKIEFLFSTSDVKQIGDWAVWNPQVFLGGQEIQLVDSNPILASTDSLNDTLEWNYGICKRILQLKPSSLIESYVFDKNPENNISIRSNINGNLEPEEYYAIDSQGTLLQGLVLVEDEKQLPSAAFDNVVFPVTITDSYTVN
jgi:hypothetical protein